jgi:hypothetical protein
VEAPMRRTIASAGIDFKWPYSNWPIVSRQEGLVGRSEARSEGLLKLV